MVRGRASLVERHSKEQRPRTKTKTMDRWVPWGKKWWMEAASHDYKMGLSSIQQGSNGALTLRGKGMGCPARSLAQKKLLGPT
jgi:hypothetical protein